MNEHLKENNDADKKHFASFLESDQSWRVSNENLRLADSHMLQGEHK